MSEAPTGREKSFKEFLKNLSNLPISEIASHFSKTRKASEMHLAGLLVPPFTLCGRPKSRQAVPSMPLPPISSALGSRRGTETANGSSRNVCVNSDRSSRLKNSHILLQEVSDEVSDEIAVLFQSKVPRIDQVELHILKVTFIRGSPFSWENVVVLSPGD